jgi:hypothetical protein
VVVAVAIMLYVEYDIIRSLWWCGSDVRVFVLELFVLTKKKNGRCKDEKRRIVMRANE